MELKISIKRQLRLQLLIFVAISTKIIIPVATDSASDKCGYSSCAAVKEGYLNVHLVPHSHDDIGWLKTIDQYYYGDKSSIQQAGVQYTLDSVVEQLQKNPSRRFIYVETGFFWRWWTNQDDETKEIVKKLVNSGQLEFINGGWCMNDEAGTHYNAIIDQMSFGMRFLNETFGECARPRVAWQIDPFGHSREQASLFAQMGFDGLFFGRLDYQDKYFRRISRNMETIWSGSPNNLGVAASLFTGVLYNGYNPPDGYCFDIFCEDEPINDDPKLFGYNLDTKVENFIRISQEWAAPYKTKNVLMTMGSDFQYMAAHTWYKNLDKLIKYVNARQLTNGSLVNLIYSTPSCYLQEVHKAGVKFTVKTDDFFPYASDPHAFWTGYFTSRPTLKYFVHQTNNFLQVCKQLGLSVLTRGVRGKSEKILEKIWSLSEAVAVLQHHDAVAGTAKQHVTDDYSTRLSIGIRDCEDVLDFAMRELVPIKDLNSQAPAKNARFGQTDSRSSTSQTSNLTPDTRKFEFCHNLNISKCDASERLGDFILSIYNPLARERNEGIYIRIPVSTPSWTVKGPEGPVSTQSTLIPKTVLEIPGRVSEAQYELIFKVDRLPALAFTNYQVTRINTEDEQQLRNELKVQLKPVKKGPVADIGGSETSESRADTTRKINGDFWIENSKGLAILFDGLSGLVKSVKRGQSEVNLNQNFYYYPGMTGNNTKFEFRASGAYIFRPNTTDGCHQPKPITERVFSYFVYKGEHVTEVHQVFTEWISQVVRLYDDSDAIEFEWLVGPINIEDHVGKEIVTKYSSDFQTNGIFFTDSNGREMIKRKRDFRPTWPYKVYEKVSGNYYPVNSRMILTEGGQDLTEGDEVKRLILLNDRAQGGTSMNDGEIEIMIHRRLLYDDAFGVGEALDEKAYGTGLVASGRHWLVFTGGDTGVSPSIHRRMAQEIFMDKMLAFSDANSIGSYSYMRNEIDVNPNPDLSRRALLYSRLGDVLPLNIHLLTLEPISNKEFILRLEHFYENGESEEFSKPVRISIQSLREALPFISHLKETTLGGNQWKSESKRFEWLTYDNIALAASGSEDDGADDDIILTPMQIKTFIVGVK